MESIMKLYLDTHMPLTVLRLDDHEYQAELGRDLAEELLSFITNKLKKNNSSLQDLTEITFYSGPGSFTGLRIGAAVVNTLADQLKIPLYDHHGTKHPVIIPDYGRPANITPPKK